MSEILPSWPLFGLGDDVRPALARAAASSRPLAVATIVALDGGGPRPVGAQMSVTRTRCAASSPAAASRPTWSGTHASFSPTASHAPPGLRRRQSLAGHPPAVRRAHRDPGRGDRAGRSLAWRAARADERRGGRPCGSPTARGAPADRAGAPPAPWQGAFARAYEPVPRLVVLGGDPTALAIACAGRAGRLRDHAGAAEGTAEPPPPFPRSPTGATSRPRRWPPSASTAGPPSPWRPTRPRPTTRR